MDEDDELSDAKILFPPFKQDNNTSLEKKDTFLVKEAPLFLQRQNKNSRQENLPFQAHSMHTHMEPSDENQLYYGGSLKDYLDKEEKKDEPDTLVHQ